MITFFHTFSEMLSVLQRMAYPSSHNPFADDDDEEETTASRSRGGFNFDDDPPESRMTEAERRQRYLQQEVMRTAQSAVDSTNRSLGLIYESEKLGTDTAEVGGSLLNTHTGQQVIVMTLVNFLVGHTT